MKASDPVIRLMHPRQMTALMCILPIIRAANGVKMAVMRELMKKHFQLVHFWALAGERWGCEGPRRCAEEAGCPHRVLQQEGGRASKAARTSICQVRQHKEGMMSPKFSHFFQVWRRFHWCWEHCKEVDFCDLRVGQHWGSGAVEKLKLFKRKISNLINFYSTWSAW